MAPYGKVFDSIFGSSIMEADVEIRYIWICLIIAADKEGFIDETVPALARRFNISVESMEKAIKYFLEPDCSSRTPDKEGRRIEPIRESFGWKIINYDYYRQLKDDEQRREYMRDYMRNYRESQKKEEPLTPVNNGKQQLAHTDTDTEYMLLVNLLYDLIKERRPSFKVPNLVNWIKPIDLMIRVDKRDLAEIEKVIKWCQQDEFWQNNILSTGKLRKQYDQLCLKMEATDAKPKRFDEEDF
jgi:hypothetical protein